VADHLGVRVSCTATGDQYRHAAVFLCIVHHRERATDAWCAAMVRGKLVTQFDDPGVRCSGRSEPDLQQRMEGPQ
jgi:hypothetical protein